MFDTLLNHDSIDPCPEIATVRCVRWPRGAPIIPPFRIAERAGAAWRGMCGGRASLETYLAQNAHKQARTLKSLLQEQESDLLQDQQQVLGVSV